MKQLIIAVLITATLCFGGWLTRETDSQTVSLIPGSDFDSVQVLFPLNRGSYGLPALEGFVAVNVQPDTSNISATHGDNTMDSLHIWIRTVHRAEGVVDGLFVINRADSIVLSPANIGEDYDDGYTYSYIIDEAWSPCWGIEVYVRLGADGTNGNTADSTDVLIWLTVQ